MAEFDAYVRASGPRLQRLAFLLTGDVDRAEDLLQTAYAKVLPRWRRVADYDDPDAYIRRVMINTRTSLWRRMRGREVSLELLPDFAPRTWEDVAEAVGTSDELLAALRALPERQRTTVVLRYYCDLPESEVASLMNCSPGTVKSNASRGLAALRATLNVAFESTGDLR